jgi:colanic acid/amylovoran biosynthesis glycosyltransferase
MPAPRAPRVAVFCRSFLPLSQTFLYDAVTQLERYRPSVFCALREHAAQFPFEDLRVAWPGYIVSAFSPTFVAAFLRERFDVIHAHFGTTAIYALPYAKLSRLPLVVTFHGYDVPLLYQARRFRGPRQEYAWLNRPALRRMTLGLCASAELRDMLIDYGVPAEKLRVHLLGIDTERIQPREGLFDAEQATPPRVLMVGRMVEKKGFRYGIEAFARAPAAAQARLTIIGSGPLDAELRALVRSLGLGERAEFTGALSHDEVLARMRLHDVLLTPCVVAANGDRDSGLLVLREGAASGLVPIATRIGGLPDSVDDGESGFLVEQRDVSTMADRLQRLLSDPALRRTMGSASRAKMVREFDHRVSIPQLEQAYDDARHAFAR